METGSDLLQSQRPVSSFGAKQDSDEQCSNTIDRHRPAIPHSVMLDLLVRFHVHPMIIAGMRGQATFQHQLVDNFGDVNASDAQYQSRGEPNAHILTQRIDLYYLIDIAYCCPMSWLWDSKSQNTIHWTHYSISSYTKYTNSGAPAFTIFLNVPHSWVQGTIQSWLRTHRYDQSHNTLRLLDHLTILSSGLDKLANSMMVPETLSLQFVSDHNTNIATAIIV